MEALLALTDPDDGRTPADRLEAVRALAASAREYTEVTAPGVPVVASDVDPRGPLQTAVSRWRTRAPMVPIQVDEPTVLLPTMRVDEARLTRALELVLGLGVCGAAVQGG